MPFYEYQCRACGYEFEALQKMGDEPLTECPACHKAELRKKVSAAAFRLKGGGWYETDFKSGDKKNVAGDENKSNDTSGNGSGDGSSGERSKDKKSDSKENKAGESKKTSDNTTSTKKPDASKS